MLLPPTCVSREDFIYIQILVVNKAITLWTSDGAAFKRKKNIYFSRRQLEVEWDETPTACHRHRPNLATHSSTPLYSALDDRTNQACK